MKPLQYILFLSVFSVMSFAEPILCDYLEKGRAVTERGCKCAVKVMYSEKDSVKVGRVVAGSCDNGKYTTEVFDIWFEGKWTKLSLNSCARLDEVKKYSCKLINYLKENYADDYTLSTPSYKKHKARLRENLDEGDVDYLFGIK